MSKRLTAKDYASDQEVRWCPGCGDYAILNAMRSALAEMALPQKDVVFVSGIGCAGRFPYYMNTYGFHTIHGRAPAVATGLKLMRPELSVWVITGDGDGLSIGGNHLIHLLRRNLDINVLLFNNRIYGLTKGQYSPTSERGKITVSSPEGSSDAPLDPIALALSAGASFVARAMDVDTKNLKDILCAAEQHHGTSFVEIYQNCNIFNDKTFAAFADKPVRNERTLNLQKGKAWSFNENQVLSMDQHFKAQVEEYNEKNEYYLHDPTSLIHAQWLSQQHYPHTPEPMGVLYQVDKPCFGDFQHRKKPHVATQEQLSDLMQGGKTWKVE